MHPASLSTHRVGRVALLSIGGSIAAAVPVAVVAALGSPWPAADAWRETWVHHRVSTALMVPLGEAVFLASWLWAIAAVASSTRVPRVSRRRRDARARTDAADAEVDVDSEDMVPPARPVDLLPVVSWRDVGLLFDDTGGAGARSEDPPPSPTTPSTAMLPFADEWEREPAPQPEWARAISLPRAEESWIERDVAVVEPTSFEEPEWHVLVTVLGLVTAVDRDGRRAVFEKSRSLELLTWLTQHRERPTRGAARTALWDLAVKDSTFANVVSDLRRGLARLVPPDDGTEWVGRTLTDDLPLDPRVVTDAELLQARLVASRGLPAASAARVLRPGLELVTGMPFSGAGAGFTWADGEGHTTAAVLLVTTAATELGSHLLQLDDIDGVFWATGQGLKVLPGHEQLIALRMQAHSARGDLAGVRLEWEQYERSIAVDPWEHAAPSPKLASLRRELLSAGARR